MKTSRGQLLNSDLSYKFILDFNKITIAEKFQSKREIIENNPFVSDKRDVNKIVLLWKIKTNFFCQKTK